MQNFEGIFIFYGACEQSSPSKLCSKQPSMAMWSKVKFSCALFFSTSFPLKLPLLFDPSATWGRRNGELDPEMSSRRTHKKSEGGNRDDVIEALFIFLKMHYFFNAMQSVALRSVSCLTCPCITNLSSSSFISPAFKSSAIQLLHALMKGAAAHKTFCLFITLVSWMRAWWLSG